MAEILGSLLNAKVSTDGGSTFKDLICQQNYSLDNTTPSTTLQTNCGPKKFFGVPAWTLSVNAVFDDDADPATEISGTEILGFQRNNTLLFVMIETPTTGSAGSKYYRGGACRVTKCTDSASTDGGVLVAVTFEGTDYLQYLPS